MSETLHPRPEAARDIDADLALCAAATPGEWETYLHTAGEYGVARIELNVFIASKRVVGVGELVGLRGEDARFIAAARTGWPDALYRLRTCDLALKDALVRANHWEAKAAQWQGELNDAVQDANHWQAEYQRLQRLNAGLAERVAAQSELLTRKAGRKTADQPPPVRNDGPAIWPLVIEDMRERDRVGRERYGTPLQAHNGRDALVDAYQEALDLAVYLRQAIEERGGRQCAKCGGSGLIDVPDKYVVQHHADCPACGGSGREGRS